MADSVLIIGRTGSGKSTAIETLDPQTTFIINVAGKPLPFKGSKKLYTPFTSDGKGGNIVSTAKAEHILKVMDIVDKDLKHIKTLVLEDFQYMSAFDYMNRSEQTGYQKFNIIAKNIYLAITKPKDMRDDLTVVFFNHEDENTDESGKVTIKAKTVGRLIDNMLSLEGLFTVVLYSTTKKSKEGIQYLFETQTDGRTTAKSPRGMFTDVAIPNDLEFVCKSIKAYNE